ncbi:MAG TPA: NAD(P)/FAD-dependent oxidoreductase [Pseudonocardia sp.]
MSDRVIVVGGGIAGLTAGFRLRQAGFDVLVLEAADRPGGRMITVERDGYRIDTGASILMTRYRAMARLISDAGLSAQILPTPDLTGFKRAGTVHRFDNHSLLGIARTSLLSARAKAHTVPVALDVLRARKKLSWIDPAQASALDTESVREYAVRRIHSDEVLDALIDPLCAAMALTGPDDMSVVDLLAYVANVFGSTFFNSATGVGFLPTGVARHLTVETAARVTGVEESAGEVSVTWTRPGQHDRTESAAGCVIATQAHDIPAIYRQLTPDQREVINSIRYSVGIGVHFGLARPPAEPSVFVAQNQRDEPDFHLAILDHNKAPGRAPAGTGLVTTYWRHHWGQRHWDDPDHDLVNAAMPAVRRLFPGLDPDIAFAHVQRWRHALLFAPPGRYASLGRFHAATPPRGRVRFSGDWLASSSTNSAIATGDRAAEQLAAVLGRPARSVGPIGVDHR